MPDAEATTYFRWWHSLQHVQPIRKIFLPWPETSETPIEFAYSLRRLFSRIPHEDFDEVEMLNLETGEKLTWTENEAMESGTWNFLISDRCVVIEGDDTYAATITLVFKRLWASSNNNILQDTNCMGYTHVTTIHKRVFLFRVRKFH